MSERINLFPFGGRLMARYDRQILFIAITILQNKLVGDLSFEFNKLGFAGSLLQGCQNFYGNYEVAIVEVEASKIVNTKVFINEAGISLKSLYSFKKQLYYVAAVVHFKCTLFVSQIVLNIWIHGADYHFSQISLRHQNKCCLHPNDCGIFIV